MKHLFDLGLLTLHSYSERESSKVLIINSGINQKIEWKSKRIVKFFQRCKFERCENIFQGKIILLFFQKVPAPIFFTKEPCLVFQWTLNPEVGYSNPRESRNVFRDFGSTNTHSFIHSGYFYSASSCPLLLRSAPDTAWMYCAGVSCRSAIGNASKGLAKAGFDPATLRTKGIESTNAPPRPT